jgi:outer membrane protein assembly factor BamB
VLASVVSHAQVGKITQQDWVTGRADAQRTSWIRGDAFISVESMQKPGFNLRWKTTLAPASQADSLAAGVVFGNLGFGSKPVSFVTSRANRALAVDNDTGVVFWERNFGSDTAAGTADCPAGITGAATRPATVTPIIPFWRGLPERGPYTSGVGAPGEGVPAYLMSPRPAAPANANTPARQSAPSPPLPQVLYALASDGQLHTLGLYSGKDVARPLPFLPPHAHASDLIALNDVVYATTTHGCGGIADGVWSLDLAGDSHVVRQWKSDAGGVVGAPAFATDGTVYVSSANALVALDPKTMTPKDRFTQAAAEFVTAPVVFTAGARDVIAVAARDGSIFLVDAVTLGALSRASSLASSELATWEDSTGTRWLLAPTATTMSAMKVTSVNNTPILEAGWTRSMRAPFVPMIVNGVAFVLSSGEPAVLYALDAATGRELWTSGRAIASSAHRPAMWAGIGQVHVATSDNIVYAFGFAMERE